MNVIEALWEVALADGVRDHEEDALLRARRPDALGVNDRDSAWPAKGLKTQGDRGPADVRLARGTGRDGRIMDPSPRRPEGRGLSTPRDR